MSGTSYSTLRDGLNSALAARLNPKGKDDWYCYVQDFDADTVIYSTGGQVFSLAFTTDSNGSPALADTDPVPVVAVTAYRPAAQQNNAPVFESRGITEMPRPRVEVVREPLTYERHTPHRSYVKDLVVSQYRQDRAATDRLARHAVEMRVERDRFDRRAATRLSESGFETRVNQTGGISDFAVPLWLNQYFATAPRPRRVLGAMIPHFDLPTGAHSINLPRVTGGDDAGTTQELASSGTTGLTDAAVTGPVVTIAGTQDVALQLLEQSPAGAHLDWAIFKDLTESYDHQLEKGLLFGSGVGESITGLVKVSGITTITDNTVPGSTAGGVLWTDIAQLVAQTATARGVAPEVLLMRTGRWTWLGQQGDTQGRPFITPGDMPDEDGSYAEAAKIQPVGSAFVPKVWVDDAIPNTYGAPANQDFIVACRPSDLMLLEGQPKTMVGMEVLSGTLSARLQLRMPVAALTGRYPTGTGLLTGTFLIYPTGY